mgnify:CR=1 FL=1
MKGQHPITVNKLYSAQWLPAGGNATSAAVDLRSISQGGRFAVHSVVSGSGTVKVESLVAPESDGTFIEPAGVSDVLPSAAAGGHAANFSQVLSPFLKRKISETGGSQPATVSLRLTVH